MAAAAKKTELDPFYHGHPTTTVDMREPIDPLYKMLGQFGTSTNFNSEAFREIVGLIREQKSEVARGEFRRDFAAYQKDAPAVERKGTGHNAKKYARLEDVISTQREALSQHGFSLNHTIKQDDGKIRIVAVLGHRGGHVETTEIVLPIDMSGNKNPVQAHASTVSYGRRYTALALLGIAPEDEDDDGQAAGAGAVISDEQKATIEAAIKFTASDVKRFCKHFKITEVGKLPADKYDAAVEMLKAKAEKQ